MYYCFNAFYLVLLRMLLVYNRFLIFFGSSNLYKHKEHSFDTRGFHPSADTLQKQTTLTFSPLYTHTFTIKVENKQRYRLQLKKIPLDINYFSVPLV